MQTKRELTERDGQVLLMRTAGMKIREIAQKVGMSNSGVRNILERNDVFLSKMLLKAEREYINRLMWRAEREAGEKADSQTGKKIDLQTEMENNIERAVQRIGEVITLEKDPSHLMSVIEKYEKVKGSLAAGQDKKKA